MIQGYCENRKNVNLKNSMHRRITYVGCFITSKPFNFQVDRNIEGQEYHKLFKSYPALTRHPPVGARYCHKNQDFVSELYLCLRILDTYARHNYTRLWLCRILMPKKISLRLN